MLNKQNGVSLSGLLVGAILLALVALLGMKVVPEVIEYQLILKTVKAVSADPEAKISVRAARDGFIRRAMIENIRTITPEELEITKDGEEVVISFAYERRIPLFMNASLLLYFEGSSQQ